MKLEVFHTDGLVIKVRHSGESDRIVTVLTRDYGVLTAFAKAARRPKSRLHSATQTFCFSDFSFRHSGEVYTITEGSVKEVFYALNEDIKNLTLAQYFGQLAMELTPPEEISEENLRLLLNSLHFLCHQKKDINFIKAVTELRMIANAGYAPNTDGCASCGSVLEDGCFLNCRAGIFTCKNCPHSADAVFLDPMAFTALQNIIHSRLERIYALIPSGGSLSLLCDAAEKFTIVQTERAYSALTFYKQIK